MTRPFIAVTLLSGPFTGSGVSVMLVLAALLGVFQCLNANFTITKSRPVKLIYLLIVLWFLLQALFGIAHGDSSAVWREIAENLPFLSFIIFVSGLELSDKTSLKRVVCAAAPAAALVTLGVAAVQVDMKLARVEGMAGNAGPFAALCLIQYGLCLLSALETGGRARLIGVAGAIAAGTCVALSGMRGLWPCLLIIPAALALLHRDVLRHLSWRAGITAGLLLLAVFAAASDRIERRIQRLGSDLAALQSGSEETTSLSQHLLIWRAGSSLFLEAPIAGRGLGHNRELMAARTREIGSEEIGFSHFHNAILTEGVQTGIAGITALLAMFFTPLVLSLRHASGEAGRHGLAVISITTVIYAFSGLTGIMFGHDLMDAIWIAAISYGSFFVFGNGRPETEEARTKSETGITSAP